MRSSGSPSGTASGSTSICMIPARSAATNCGRSPRARLAAGLDGRVAVSHAFALGARRRRRVRPHRRGARARGRRDHDQWPRARSRCRRCSRLVAAGVRVFAGSDNIRDAWSPLGNGDMLERAMLIAYRQDFRADADLELAFDLTTLRERRRCSASRTTGSGSARPRTSWRCRRARSRRRWRRGRREAW